MRTTVHVATIENSYPVRLIQTGIDSFTVAYGQQIKRRLNYGQAALEFGACVMHSAACAGRLDNRERGET